MGSAPFLRNLLLTISFGEKWSLQIREFREGVKSSRLIILYQTFVKFSGTLKKVFCLRIFCILLQYSASPFCLKKIWFDTEFWLHNFLSPSWFCFGPKDCDFLWFGYFLEQTWGWKFKIPIFYIISLRNPWFNKYSKFCTQYCLQKHLLSFLYLPCRDNNNLFVPKQPYRHVMSRSLCIIISIFIFI